MHTQLMLALQICKELYENPPPPQKKRKALVADSWVTVTDVVYTQGVHFLIHKEHLELTHNQHVALG